MEVVSRLNYLVVRTVAAVWIHHPQEQDKDHF